jgi:hypothetical protein
MLRLLTRSGRLSRPTPRRSTALPRLEALEDRLVPATYPLAQLHSAGEYMLTLINRARANPTAEAARFGIDLNEGLAPGTISAAAKQPLAPNAALLSSIEGHLNWWLSAFNPNVAPPHVESNGSTPQSRAAAAGYGNPNGVGENLAWRWQSPAPALQAFVDAMYKDLFVDSTIQGRGHRLNILNPSYQEIGSDVLGGFVPAGFQGAGSDLVLTGQDFGIPQAGNAFLTGAVYTDANGNGSYDIGEGLGGVTISVAQGSHLVATTTTFDSGAYSLRLAPGTYTIIASGGGLSGPRSKTVTLGNTNVLADLTQADASGGGGGTGAAAFVVGQFGTGGVWRWNSASGWQQLTTGNATQVAIDARGDVAGEFSGGGVWRFEDSTGWQQLTTANAAALAIAGPGDVAISISGAGVWRFEDATGWREVTTATASAVGIDNAGDVAGEFSGFGVWRFKDATGWAQLTTADASHLVMGGNGGVAGVFAGAGVWRFEDGTGWRQLTTADATSLAINARGDVAGQFGSSGVWRFQDGTGWAQLTTGNAGQVAIDDSGAVAGEFSGGGVWLYSDAARWKQLTPADAAWLALAGA